MATDDAVRNIALIEEVETAMGLAQLGLGAIQRIGGSNAFYHLPLQLLASSKERLLKTMLAIHSKQSTGQYPSQNQMKNFGHDTAKLLDSVTKPDVFGEEETFVEAVGHDLKFLKSDTTYRNMIDVLSHFGRFGRYSNLDVIAGRAVEVHPDSEWTQVENETLSEEDFAAGLQNLRPKINVTMTSKLERGYRGLARWFTIGNGNPAGKTHSHALKPFLNLTDSQLGQTEWPGVDKQQ